MKIETFDRDDHQKKVVVEFENDTLERFKRQAARKISAETRFPGFRPGKAPYEMVRRTVGDQAIKEEAISLMLDEVYPQVVKEAGIQSYGPGQLEEIISEEPPKFSFIIPLAPVIDLGEYKELRLDYNPPTVEETKVDEMIERLRRRVGTAVPIERPAEKGDLVAIKLSAKLSEPPEGEEGTLIEEGSYEMVAGTPEDHTDEDGHEWPYKGFVNELVGLHVGETKTFEHTFEDDGSSDDLTGKTASFHVEVESIKEIAKPEVNEDFVKSLGPYEDLDALRKDILRQLQETETRKYNREYYDGLIEKLMDGAKVLYPPILLDEEVEHLLAHFQEDLAQQKLDLETYLKTRNMTREELVEKEIKPAAETRIKRQLVLEEFASRENIQLQPYEMQMIFDMAKEQAKNDPQFAQIRSGAKISQKQLADTLARGTVNEIFNQRLMNRLRDIATGKADAPAEPAPETAPEAAAEGSQPAAEAPAPAPESAAPQAAESSSDEPAEPATAE